MIREAASMIVLGLLLIVLAVGASAVAVTAPSASSQVIEMSALGVKVSASPLAMFLAGAVSVVLLGLGFGMIAGGTRRKARRRRELRDLRKDQAAASTEGTATHRGADTTSTEGTATDRGADTTSTEGTATDRGSTGTSTDTSSTDTSSTDTSSTHAGEGSSRRERLLDGTGTDTAGT